jgi:hypothetical protein
MGLVAIAGALTIAGVSVAAAVGGGRAITARPNDSPVSAANGQYAAKKVTVCHHTRSKNRPWATISILESTLPAHLRHGDTVGACIKAFVGPGPRIGLAAKVLKQSRIYAIIVSDLSRTDNFHLSCPTLDRKTGIAFRGVVRFKVLFTKAGVCQYRSDAHLRLRGTVIVGELGSALRLILKVER